MRAVRRAPPVRRVRKRIAPPRVLVKIRDIIVTGVDLIDGTFQVGARRRVVALGRARPRDGVLSGDGRPVTPLARPALLRARIISTIISFTAVIVRRACIEQTASFDRAFLALAIAALVVAFASADRILAFPFVRLSLRAIPVLRLDLRVIHRVRFIRVMRVAR